MIFKEYLDKEIQSQPTHSERDRGSRGQQLGQGNFELATNCDYIHEGRLTLAKVSVSVGFQSLP